MAEHTMLLVDDVDMNLEILETIFEEHFRILKAHNGIEALDILKHDKVDIVILDIVMPVMDGFETLERIRSDKALMDIPVVVSTAEGGEKLAFKMPPLPVTRKLVITNRMNVVNMFNNYLNDKEKDERDKLSGSIGKIIIK